MPLKLDLSQFSLNQFRSYARFDNGQEEKLGSALDRHFAVERFVCALETAIKQRPGILIGGVPIGESTDGQIVFQITCMHKITTPNGECEEVSRGWYPSFRQRQPPRVG